MTDEKEPRRRGLDPFEALTARFGPRGRFEVIDQAVPNIPDFEQRRVQKRDADLKRAYERSLGLQQEAARKPKDKRKI